VKHSSADDSVGSPHVKVGHRQGFILEADTLFNAKSFGFFFKLWIDLFHF
jgi:hypothetical protein